MMSPILIAVIILGSIGLTLSFVLYLVSKKFAVKEDPRIGQILEVLPGANCGGCGYPGCGGLAVACVKAADAGSLDGVSCPVGGAEVMEKVASIVGLEVKIGPKQVAVLRCSASCNKNPRVAQYDGATSCRIANTTSMGETKCAWGCLGLGDCVAKCLFGALSKDSETGEIKIDYTLCTACGACAKACPRQLIEIRQVTDDLKAIVVNCRNKDKGIVAKSACDQSCIGCKICEKNCESNAVIVTDNVATIDGSKCTLCRKCEESCPRGAIISIGLPALPPKEKRTAPKAASSAPVQQKSVVVNATSTTKETNVESPTSNQ